MFCIDNQSVFMPGTCPQNMAAIKLKTIMQQGLLTYRVHSYANASAIVPLRQGV